MTLKVEQTPKWHGMTREDTARHDKAREGTGHEGTECFLLESNPEKRRLRRQYSQKEDPATKMRINQFQKQVKEELRIESLVSWEKFCNSISLENNAGESWSKIKNFVKPKGQRDYPALHHANKVAKTNADKAQLSAESVERHLGIESIHFDSNHFDEANKSVEDTHRYFYPPEDPDLMWEMSTSL